MDLKLGLSLLYKNDILLDLRFYYTKATLYNYMTAEFFEKKKVGETRSHILYIMRANATFHDWYKSDISRMKKNYKSLIAVRVEKKNRAYNTRHTYTYKNHTLIIYIHEERKKRNGVVFEFLYKILLS